MRSAGCESPFSRCDRPSVRAGLKTRYRSAILGQAAGSNCLLVMVAGSDRMAALSGQIEQWSSGALLGGQSGSEPGLWTLWFLTQTRTSFALERVGRRIPVSQDLETVSYGRGA